MKKEIHIAHTECVINAEAGWQRVAPYCEAPYINSRGEKAMQIFSKKIAEDIVNDFNSRIKRALRWFSGANSNIPFYNGHPDHSSAEVRDCNVYAEADKLEARNDGLWAHIIHHPILETLKDALGKREISPRWNCISNGNNLIPVELISFGLVDKGNLPNADVINMAQEFSQNYTKMDIDLIKSLAEKLGLEEENATAEAIANAVENLQTSNAELLSGEKNREAELKAKDDEISALKEEIEKMKSDSEAVSNELKCKDKELSKIALDNAWEEGKLTPEARKEYEDDEEMTLEKLREILENLPILQKEPASNQVIEPTAKPAKNFWDLVNEFQRKHKCTRSMAIECVNATAEGKSAWNNV